jgi:restriction system protein
METPKYYEFMNPILQALREGGGTLTNDEIVDAVVTRMQLPDDVLERQQHGHNLGEVEYRIAWAKSYLKQAGYLTQSERGVWALTPKGKDTPRINERAIVTAIRKAYVARRKEKIPPPTIQSVQEEAVQETSAAEEIEEELSWK